MKSYGKVEEQKKLDNITNEECNREENKKCNGLCVSILFVFNVIYHYDILHTDCTVGMELPIR